MERLLVYEKPELIELVKEGGNDPVPGVEGEFCQVLRAPGDNTRDWGLVTTKLSTRPQTILRGAVSEIYISGEGEIRVVRLGEKEEVYEYPGCQETCIKMTPLDTMQLINTGTAPFITLEKCEPPFDDEETFFNGKRYECISGYRRLENEKSV